MASRPSHGNDFDADLAKFSWKCSLALVLIMVAAETFHFIHPAPKLAKPVLGIQANGWNSDFFGGPLKVGIWEGEWAAAHSDQPPYDTEVKNSQPVTYMIQGSYTCTVDVSALATGVYECIIKSGQNNYRTSLYIVT